MKLNIEKYGRWFINLPQFNFENIDWEESTLALVYLPIHYDNSFFRLGVVSNNELGYIPTNVGFKHQGLPDKTIHLINSRRDSFTKLQSIIINELKQDICSKFWLSKNFKFMEVFMENLADLKVNELLFQKLINSKDKE